MAVTVLGRDGAAPRALVRARALETEASANARPIRAAQAVVIAWDSPSLRASVAKALHPSREVRRGKSPAESSPPQTTANFAVHS